MALDGDVGSLELVDDILARLGRVSPGRDRRDRDGNLGQVASDDITAGLGKGNGEGAGEDARESEEGEDGLHDAGVEAGGMW